MHRCAAEAPVHFSHGKQTRLPVQRKGQAQQEHSVFSLQLKQAAAAAAMPAYCGSRSRDPRGRIPEAPRT